MAVCGGMTPPREAEAISAGPCSLPFPDLAFMSPIGQTQLEARGQRSLLL